MLRLRALAVGRAEQHCAFRHGKNAPDEWIPTYNTGPVAILHDMVDDAGDRRRQRDGSILPSAIE